MLESKWPTSDTNALQLWTKVKHVVRAVSYLRQAVKARRPRSVYSMSSESDRISRTSTDSYLDEMVPPQDRTDYVSAAAARLTGAEQASAEGPSDERISTGQYTLCVPVENCGI